MGLCLEFTVSALNNFYPQECEMFTSSTFYSVVNVFLNKYPNYRLLESHRIVGYFASQFRRKTEGLVKSILGGGKHCSSKHTDRANRSPLGPVLSRQQSKQKVLG